MEVSFPNKYSFFIIFSLSKCIVFLLELHAHLFFAGATDDLAMEGHILARGVIVVDL